MWEAMAHPSVGSPGSSTRLRTVRPDGTPVYRYQQRPGLPPVSVIRFDTGAAHAEPPPDHRHAHDFLLLVYVEEGGGLCTVDGAERPLSGTTLPQTSHIFIGHTSQCQTQPMAAQCCARAVCPQASS